MAELFRFEISKIFRKKLVLFSVLGVLAFSGMMIISWGVNAYPIQGTDVMKHYTRNWYCSAVMELQEMKAR